MNEKNVTETQKVDVLAVIDAIFDKPSVKASEVAYRKRDVYQARAAAAELIEAANAAIDAIADGDAQSARNELNRALQLVGGDA